MTPRTVLRGTCLTSGPSLALRSSDDNTDVTFYEELLRDVIVSAEELARICKSFLLTSFHISGPWVSHP